MDSLCSNSHERLEGVPERIAALLSKGVERVSEASLTHELQRGAAHPVDEIDFGGTTLRRNDLLQSLTKLKRI